MFQLLFTVFMLLPAHSPVSFLPDPNPSEAHAPPLLIFNSAHLCPRPDWAEAPAEEGEDRRASSSKESWEPALRCPNILPDCPQRLFEILFCKKVSSSSLLPSFFTVTTVLSEPSHRPVLNSSLSGIISHRQQRISNVISRDFSLKGSGRVSL